MFNNKNIIKLVSMIHVFNKLSQLTHLNYVIQFKLCNRLRYGENIYYSRS